MTEQLTPPRAAPADPASRSGVTTVWLVAAAVTVVALVASRLNGLSRSLWWDEAFTAHRYVRGGAEIIFDPSQYYANNHVLYSLLASWTTDLLWTGDAVLRLWVVGPALAGAGLVLWWAWRRLAPAVAVTATALVVISPLAVRLQTEARGYGLVLLSASVLLVVTSRGADHPARWRDDLAVAAAGAVGMLTFPPVVTLYVAHTGVWFLRRTTHRLRLVALTAATGALTALVLRPLFGPMLDNASSVGSRAADPITWWSPIVGPFTVIGGPSFNPILPGGSSTAAAVTMVLGVAGLIALLVRSRSLAVDHPHAGFEVGLQLLASLGVSIALLGFVGFSLLDRYVAFTLPAVMIAVAAGIVAIARLATRDRPALTATAVLVVLALAGGLGAERVHAETAQPRQEFAGAVEAIRASDPATVVVRRLHVGYAWYFGRFEVDVVRTDDGAEATAAFCDGPRPAVYVPDPDREPADGPACLGDAVRHSVPQRVGDLEMVWYELP
ncbi:hypothetical protein [Nitriliruptor alkaliphilus]|uniref:hypothetical protein n=1 Tax=Nitriliruptor alkaliphilus TaxID=427918 RepID=UPI0006980C23|nr:hypothetical protein [Nitriliruptor alkaliphilus]